MVLHKAPCEEIVQCSMTSHSELFSSALLYASFLITVADRVIAVQQIVVLLYCIVLYCCCKSFGDNPEGCLPASHIYAHPQPEVHDPEVYCYGYNCNISSMTLHSCKYVTVYYWCCNEIRNSTSTSASSISDPHPGSKQDGTRTGEVVLQSHLWAICAVHSSTQC